MKVLVLGAGKMMEAILTGLKGQEDLTNWFLYSPSGTSAKRLSEKVGARYLTKISECPEPDFVFIACKPQQLPDLKRNLGNSFLGKTFVSILAALPEKQQSEILGIENLIRVMPNLPVAERLGVSLLSSESSPDKLSVMESLFKKMGTALIVKEAELEELTLLTGSGPAFFYEFTHELAEGFTSLDSERREKLARQVLLGSAVSAQKSEHSLDEMMNAVTSKGGVTIATLESFREKGLKSLIQEGIRAGKKRALELKSHLLHK